MFSETHRLVNYSSILEMYLESAYFAHEFERFRDRHIGFCSRNGRQYEFRSDSYAVYFQKIGAQAIDVALLQKMTDGMIGKCFNSGYSTKQLFVILMGLLVEADEAQLMQLEDPRCSFCSRSSCVVYALKKPPQFLICQYRIRKKRTASGRCTGKKHTS